MIPGTLPISDLRGGINNSDSPQTLPDNQVVDARNVDFREGVLGSKRRGTAGIDMTGSIINSPVVATIRHTPSNSLSNDELWAIDQNGNLDRRVGGSWQGGVPRVNTNVTINAGNFDANGASLHGKLFLAAQGAQDRLMVWDGTTLRWAGFWQTPVPTIANSAVAGSYANTRYCRIRFVTIAGGIVTRRSEPSNTISIAPDGAHNGIVITKPAGTEVNTSIYCEGQTHWEVELSLDNILFYRVAQVAIGTATYTDTTAYATGYSSNPLSDPIGNYVAPSSCRHVAIDEDRVLMAGSFFTPGNDATVFWTPVGSDPTGVANDERIPTATSNFLTFDGLDGGSVQAMVSGVAGNVYVFKASRLYKMIRTGIVTGAYDPTAESYARGSTFRGACAGTDKDGIPCVYFLDPSVGLCRIGHNGVERLAWSIRSTWQGRNPMPALNPRIIYYPTLEQVWFTLPVNPSSEIHTVVDSQILTASGSILAASQASPGLLGIYESRYGSLMFHDGVPASAQALGLITGTTGIVPVIGTQLTAIGGGNNSYLHTGDTGTTDSSTNFLAYVLTKPYTLGTLWQKFGITAGLVLAKAAAGTLFLLRFIRNYGIEQSVDKLVSLTPPGAQTRVIGQVDNAYLSELNSVQIQYGDQAASPQAWTIDALVFKVRSEDGSI
jgi:hypothetical protein